MLEIPKAKSTFIGFNYLDSKMDNQQENIKILRDCTKEI